MRARIVVPCDRNDNAPGAYRYPEILGPPVFGGRRRNRAGSGAAGRRGLAVFLPLRRLRQLQGHLAAGALRVSAQPAAGAERQRAGPSCGAAVPGRADQRPAAGGARGDLGGGHRAAPAWHGGHRQMAAGGGRDRLASAARARRAPAQPAARSVCGCTAGGGQAPAVFNRQRPAGGRHDRVARAPRGRRRLHFVGQRCLEGGRPPAHRGTAGYLRAARGLRAADAVHGRRHRLRTGQGDRRTLHRARHAPADAAVLGRAHGGGSVYARSGRTLGA